MTDREFKILRDLHYQAGEIATAMAASPNATALKIAGDINDTTETDGIRGLFRALNAASRLIAERNGDEDWLAYLDLHDVPALPAE